MIATGAIIFETEDSGLVEKKDGDCRDMSGCHFNAEYRGRYIKEKHSSISSLEEIKERTWGDKKRN
jgi:hypothetical protein